MTSSEQLSDQQKAEKDTIFTFPNGIPGFEDCTSFRLFHKKTRDKSVFILQADKKPELAFTLVDPVDYGLNYDFTLSDKEQEILGAESVEEMTVLLMLAKYDDTTGGKQSGEPSLHANIAGPLIFNVKSRRGYQKLLQTMDYSLNVHGE